MILSVYIDEAFARFGIVFRDGKVTRAKKFDTRDWVASSGILRHLIAELKGYFHTFPETKQVAIGLPGILSADRRMIIQVPHMPELDNLPLGSILQDEFPGNVFKIERSGDCLALGELHAGNYDFTDFLLISLDGCTEAAAVKDGKVFNGFNSNGIHLASMPLTDGHTLEKELRWHSLEEYIYGKLDEEVNERSVLAGKGLSAELVCQAALQGDNIARSVFEHTGYILGKALVAVVPVLDVSTILLTGRLAAATNLMLPAITRQLKSHLAPYYTRKLFIRKAAVGEKAGILGAACLFN
jgi:glucokinase